MGLDGIELLIEVEDRFGIAIDDAEGGRVRTVGDLHDLVLAKLTPSRSSTCLSSHVFYRLRGSLRERFGVPRAEIYPQVRLTEVVPGDSRRLAWKALADSLGWRLPELRRPKGLETSLAVGFLLAVTVAIIGGAIGYLPVAAWLTIGLGAWPTVWLCYRATTPLAVHFPPQCLTVGNATDAILALNFAKITQEREAWNEREVWNALRDTIVGQLGVEPEAVVRSARFVEDLRVD